MPRPPIHLKLKNILHLSKCNHKNEIIKQSSNIKDAHIYCKVNQLSGQISGPLIEYYIKNTYNMTKNNSSLCIGDLKYKNKNIEIKISTGGKENNKFNYVQLRINHNCDYILTAYYLSEKNIKNNGELFIFRLNKNNMKNIILKFGNYAHGTIQKLGIINKKDLNDHNNDKEYAIRPKYGDKCWNELLKYKIDNI
jgi:hypothetical protein